MQPKQFLIVDDEKEIADLLTYIISESGHKAFACYNVDEAIQFLEYNETNCLITDFNMPEKNGLYLIKHIRNNLKLNIPIYIITAFEDAKLFEKSFSIREILNKPIKYEDVIKIVEST